MPLLDGATTTPVAYRAVPAVPSVSPPTADRSGTIPHRLQLVRRRLYTGKRHHHPSGDRRRRVREEDVGDGNYPVSPTFLLRGDRLGSSAQRLSAAFRTVQNPNEALDRGILKLADSLASQPELESNRLERQRWSGNTQAKREDL